MLENQLHALIRTTLLAGFAGMPGYMDVQVKRAQQPMTVGANTAPTIYAQTIIPARRVGWLGRKDRDLLGIDLSHTETQWLETTLQLNGLAWRPPTAIDLPSAADITAAAASILQSDAGLAAMGAQRVRPLRITEVRQIYFVNERDQYEANPSFDIVLSHVQIRESATPPVVQFAPNAGRV